ncbi:Hypothetical predicted protein [Paramuricea clavata]|uniref:Uncharacterized protein n=1 Tax=Paramuricea clavata TaxID=317549 RepID=A0A7D9HSX6_PARCT|nr:Hypothetical predicted protein [Paramuricea clavata]
MSMVTNLPQNLETLKSRTFHFAILKEKTSTNVPVHYSFKELGNCELPVMGTYVHSHVLPGVRYRVRLSDTNEYLFGGKALKLESIGQGYGKRITFESKDILENNNFFWSDSHEAGFAFSPEILSGGEVFQVMDNVGKRVGIFSVDSVNQQQQITGVTLEKNTVNIHAKASLCGNMQLLSQYEKDIPVVGEVILKVNRFSCTLEFLKTENSVLDTVWHFVKHFK